MGATTLARIREGRKLVELGVPPWERWLARERGGRVILNLPGPTPRLFIIMEEALARHIGSEAAGFVNRVFSLHDTAEIQNLVSGAGFHDVPVQFDTKPLRLPPPGEFLWQYVHGTPLAGAVAQVDDERHSSVEREVVAKW